jgi:hypothetical protein
LPRSIKSASGIGHADFQSRPNGPFGDSKIRFWNMKGGRDPTNGHEQDIDPQALRSQGFPLAKPFRLHMLTLVYI